jgi:hypothetical protein
MFGAGLAGCVVDDPTSAAVRAPSLSRGANERRPLSGSCETAFAPPALPPPPVIRQVDEGVCELAHLGRAALYSVQDIDIGAGTQRSVEFTFTAANGDELRAMNVGTNAPNGPGVTFQATMSFIGGTGRFANATGEARVVGAASFITNTASFTLDGWIAYGGTSTK